jgi:hypothetical protein
MDLYNASKFSTSNSNHFLNINQEFQKNFHRLSLVRLPYMLMKHLPYVVSKLSAVRVSEISAALSAVSVNKILQF